MKKNMKSSSILLGGLFLLGAVCSCTQTAPDYASYVNPFIGTGGHGHTYPGAVVPNGMIQPSPDTRIYEWDACSGYYYADTTINGFSHTHVSGTGCADYGDVLLMPTVGRQDYHSMGSKSQQMAYASAFSHENETAEPGYYSVFLDRYGVKAELTSTKRAAIHRYTFPKAEDAGFILDLDYSIQRQKNEQMELEVISDTEIRGRKKTVYWAFDQYINFYAKFSKPFTYTLVTDSMALDEGGPLLPTAKALLQFQTEPNEEVLVKVGVSAVDMDGARKNVEAEISGWDFDGVRRAARQQWNTYLSKIDIDTKDNDQRTMFYTALYHTGMQPNLFTDADGRYFGMDLKPHQGRVDEPIYTIFSLWDTFRAYHPLMTIIDPELNEAFIRSLIQKSREGGVLPMWELENTVPLIAHQLTVGAVGQKHRQHLGPVQRRNGDQVEKPHTNGHGGHRKQAPLKENIHSLAVRRVQVDHLADSQKKDRQKQVGHRPRQRRDRHALLGLAEIIGIHRHGLGPTEAHRKHQRQTQPVDVVQRIQGQPVHGLRRGVSQRQRRQPVTGLMDRQAEEHRRYTEHRVSQRGNIQRLKQILQIMQHKTLQ